MIMTHKYPFDLTGQLALITGGGSGLGLGIAQAMVDAGARVILAGRTEAKLAAATEALGSAANFVVHDITDLGKSESFAQRVCADFGVPDTLVNNAGIHLKKTAEEISDSEFHQVMRTHVDAAFSLSREFAKPMLERGSGHILFIASMASYMGIPKVAAYSAAKSAHLGLVRALAADFSPRGVRVNAIAPGWIHSDMMHRAVNADPERKRKILSRTPMGDFGNPEDVGHAAVYLSAPAAKFITGVSLPVDGGASIGF